MTAEIPQYDYDKGQLNLNSIWPITDKHGPGRRIAIWTQGCSLNCEGCINAHMHPDTATSLKPVEEIVTLIGEATEFCTPIEGISLMGGEPMEQARAVRTLLERIQTVFPNLNILLFTGYKLEFLRRAGNPDIDRILEIVDTVIDGRYDENKRNPNSIAGSKNQVIHHLNQKRLYGRDFRRKGSANALTVNTDEIQQHQTAFAPTDF